MSIEYAMRKITHFNIELTKKCNQKCFYCFNDSGCSKSSEELSLKDWLGLITSIYHAGYKSIHITGGEPFIHPDILEILSHCINNGLTTSILSNGFQIAGLVEKYSALFEQLSVAQISLDSIDPEIHNSRRGYKYAYDDAMTAINALLRINVPIEISTTVSEQNIEHLEGIAEFCEKIGASLIVRPIIAAGRARFIQSSQVFYEHLTNSLNFIDSSYEVNLIDDRYHYVNDEYNTKKAYGEFGVITVEATGNIKGNLFSETNILNLTNILKTA